MCGNLETQGSAKEQDWGWTEPTSHKYPTACPLTIITLPPWVPMVFLSVIVNANAFWAFIISLVVYQAILKHYFT